MTISIIFLVALALAFDFLNGFHDSANAIATVVSTRSLWLPGARMLVGIGSDSANASASGRRLRARVRCTTEALAVMSSTMKVPKRPPPDGGNRLGLAKT